MVMMMKMDGCLESWTNANFEAIENRKRTFAVLAPGRNGVGLFDLPAFC
jgi:hypothetical protein